MLVQRLRRLDMRYFKLFLIVILMSFTLLFSFPKGHSWAQPLWGFEIQESRPLKGEVFVKSEGQFSDAMASREGLCGLGAVKVFADRMMFEPLHCSFHSLYFQEQLNHSPPSLRV